MKEYNVPAVEKAFMIIEHLAASEVPLRMTDISNSLCLPKSSALVTLATLEKLGYVVKVAENKYSLSNKLTTLASKSSSLKGLAREYLELLAEDLRYTVHLSILRNNENVLLDKVAGPGFFQFATFVGKRQPFHATSSGKAMLAFVSPEQRREILANLEMPKYTINTITSVEQLMADLEITAQRGFSLENEEEEISVRCVGAPIYNAAGEVVAAVSITATTAEFALERLPEVGQRVSNTAAKISHRLGVFSNTVI
jgi:DNA-binding IclR family transcriptional regulator